MDINKLCVDMYNYSDSASIIAKGALTSSCHSRDGSIFNKIARNIVNSQPLYLLVSLGSFAAVVSKNLCVKDHRKQRGKVYIATR